MKKNPKRFTIRKRRDCDRWELIIRDPEYGQFYGGLYSTRQDALQGLKRCGLNEDGTPYRFSRK